MFLFLQGLQKRESLEAAIFLLSVPENDKFDNERKCHFKQNGKFALPPTKDVQHIPLWLTETHTHTHTHTKSRATSFVV